MNFADYRIYFYHAFAMLKPYKDDLERDHETIRGKGIKDGKTFDIMEGDIICIPLNTPHSVDARDSEIMFITVKIDDVIVNCGD